MKCRDCHHCLDWSENTIQTPNKGPVCAIGGGGVTLNTECKCDEVIIEFDR